jgi:hypothetical protein
MDHPLIVSTYDTEESGKDTLNVVTTVELAPAAPGFDAQVRARLIDDLRPILLDLSSGYQQITFHPDGGAAHA